jgi:hypothetical protein
MAKYLKPELVHDAFARLSSRNNAGKLHKERTSVLLYFLAVDAACKYFDVSSLDLNPNSLEGRQNRKQVELEFTKLVLVEHSQDVLKQVTELGKLDASATSPEKRISSNFFTVPLKKATDQVAPYYYPRRPAAPVLKMGAAATGIKWGISHHENWRTNLLALLVDIKSPTHFLDLAIFACRDCAFDDSVIELVPAFEEQIQKHFTKNMADFWVSKIQKEIKLARHIDVPFIDHYSSFSRFYKQDQLQPKRYERMSKTELIDRIHKLESMLGASD